MIDLERIYDNLFWPMEVAESDWVEGAERHIALLEASNPGGIYDVILLAITAKVQAAKNAISARDSENTEKEGSTITMTAAKDDFIKFVRIREGLIKSTFEGDDTAQYQEFFPHGLTEYTNATLGTIEMLMDRMVTKATKYETELGTPFKTACIAKRTAYLAARDAQRTNIGEAVSLEAAAQTALYDVSLQLCIDLHETAKNNPGNPNAAKLFFDQSFFVPSHTTGIYSGENTANQTKTVRRQGWTAEREIKVTNTGTAAFFIGFANADGTPVSTLSVESGSTVTTKVSDIGYDEANKYLNVTAGPEGAAWKVEVL